MQERLELLAGDPEWDHAWRVIVHDRVHVRSRLEDGAVDEALEIGRAPARIDSGAVEGELHDVVRLDALRRPRPRQEEMLRIVGVAGADMPERVDDAFVGEDAVGGDDFIEQAFELGHRRNSSSALSPMSSPANAGDPVTTGLLGGRRRFDRTGGGYWMPRQSGA